MIGADSIGANSVLHMKHFVMRQLQLGLLFLILALPAFGQKSTYQGFPSLVWPKLYNITFEKAKDDLGEYDKPVFTAEVKALAGKSVSLPGYIVPFENGARSAHFMFSSLPLNACFFCGVGGPETVVEVHLKKPVTYTDRPVEVRGVLRINDSNPDEMIYVLEQAELISEIDY